MKKILIVGNFTKDIIYYGNYYKESIGGPPHYISRVLQDYNDVKIIILSSIGRDFPSGYIDKLCTRNIECIIERHSLPNIVFKNIYENDKRIQILEGGEYKIRYENIESVGDVDFAIVSPVYNEIDYSFLEDIRSRYKSAVDPQGFLRKRSIGNFIKLVKSSPIYFSKIDILKPSREEFRVLTDNYTDINSIRSFAESIIVTDGVRGSYLLGHDIYHIPAYIIRDVDSTGAGDMYLGLLVYHILKGFELIEACIHSTAIVSLYLEGLSLRSNIVEERVYNISDRVKILHYEHFIMLLKG